MTSATLEMTALEEGCELLTLALSDGVGVVIGDRCWFTVEAAPVLDEVYEMETGADVTGATVTESAVSVRGKKKMGQGRTPYADDPAYHRKLLNHPTLEQTEGTVVYADFDRLHLPKTLYFEEEVEFEDPSSVDSPATLAAAVSSLLGIDIEYEPRNSGGDA